MFLSYAGADRAVAARVVLGLRAAGADVWWDQDGIGWGDNWIETLQNTLTTCSAYVILVGAGGVRRWVKAELHIATRRHFENDLPVFPILLNGVAPESLPPFLSIFQTESLPEDLARFDFAELADRLKAVPASEEDARPGLDDSVCPFPGLEAFREDEARFFFGRQSETLDALRRLGPGLDGVYRRWLQIEGPSGVGKSSVVRAGLVPAIRRGWIQEGDSRIRRWLVAPPMRPGADAIENLATALSRSLEGRSLSLGAFDQELRAGGVKAFRHLLRQCVAEGEGFVLVIDQLEELFTLTARPEDREHFEALLAEALQDLDGPLHLITTIRSDFMLRFAELPRLQGMLNNAAGRYLLPPISEAGLKDVVRTPARLAGLHWSEALLPDDIVSEAVAEPGALPLVGNLLRLLWDERDGNVLSARVYRELGGLGGALAKRADLLLDSLDKEVRSGRDRAKKLLLELVEPGRASQDSRRTITRQMALAAADGGPEAEVVLDRLSGLRGATTPRDARATPRLVVVSGREADDRADVLVDLAHEALLRKDRRGQPYWRTLRDWVDQHRKRLEDRRLLEMLAEKWWDEGRSWVSNELARGRQFNDFRRVAAALGDRPASYLRASQRLRWLRSAAFGGIAVMTVGAGVAWWGNEWARSNNTTWRVPLRLLAVEVGLGGFAAPPQMVELPPGSFTMGSDEAERQWVASQGDKPEWGLDYEQPPHEIKIARAFAIGKYEVTFDDWDVCVADGGCDGYKPFDEGWGTGRRPVVNVSWDDANEYVAWLSRVAGAPYRLPSEAEWEYAARAGTDTAYWWGDQPPDPKQANFGETKMSREIGSHLPNHWGLHDMNGNVWEWVQDCWNDSYAAPACPDDGSAWLEGNCSRRVQRGGSWKSVPVRLRSAHRSSNASDKRDRVVGFRIARTLP